MKARALALLNVQDLVSEQPLLVEDWVLLEHQLMAETEFQPSKLYRPVLPDVLSVSWRESVLPVAVPVAPETPVSL
ncbi:MAG: hypothetical protein ACKO5M_11765 [Vulcanococcus sp.]